MERITLPNSDISSSRLIYGCMRISGENTLDDRVKGKRAIRAAIEAGYNHFDHADIYGGGNSELLFGEILKESPELKQQLFITSKAGIRQSNSPNEGDPARYDFSKRYILESVECSLKRLNLESLDMFLLHRPDYLMDAHEVAETFSILKASGKVKHFGVSNFNVAQTELLKSVLPMPLLVNQIEINIHNISAIEDSTLDYCQQHKILPIAWCPLGGVAYSAWGNTFSGDDESRIEAEIAYQCRKYQCQNWQLILAWLLKHPAKIIPIIGSTTPSRINAAVQALSIEYSREDWYRLFEARKGYCVP